MNNCIFTAHCLEANCDKSCPTYVETSYLLERNGISISSYLFSDPRVDVPKLTRILDTFNNKEGVIVVNNTSGGFTTVQWAEALTYCAICNNWKGSRLHCVVYNLKLSKYLDDVKQSWSSKTNNEDLEYVKIWSENAKVLIISNFDFVNFGDFESQTLLNLLQTRQIEGKTTILVSPPISQLVSSKSSMFFNMLRSRMSSEAREVSKC